MKDYYEASKGKFTVIIGCNGNNDAAAQASGLYMSDRENMIYYRKRRIVISKSTQYIFKSINSLDLDGYNVQEIRLSSSACSNGDIDNIVTFLYAMRHARTLSPINYISLLELKKMGAKISG